MTAPGAAGSEGGGADRRQGLGAEGRRLLLRALQYEVIAAINDYLFGAGEEAISKAEVVELINLNLFG